MLKLSVIGCGHWGPNFIRNFQQIKGVLIKHACDLNPQRLSYIREFYPQIVTTQDYVQILKDKDIDAVVIATPAHTHYRLAKEFLLSNKHILVEKPISLKTEGAEELINISKKLKRVFMVGHTFLFNPAVSKIKEIINKKELGRIYYIHSRRTNLGPLREDVNAIWDLSPHDISIINYLLGKMPVEVTAYGQRFLSHRLEDVGFIILKYPGNILAHIHVSWLDPKKIREMTIIGSDKMLVYEDTNINEPIRIYDKAIMNKKYDKEYRTFKEFQLIIKDGKVTTPRVNMEEPLKKECQHFIDCIVNNKRSLADGYEGLNIVKILEAINTSIKINKIVKIK